MGKQLCELEKKKPCNNFTEKVISTLWTRITCSDNVIFWPQTHTAFDYRTLPVGSIFWKKKCHLSKCFQTRQSLILDMVNQLLSQQIYTFYSVLLTQLNLTKKKGVATLCSSAVIHGWECTWNTTLVWRKKLRLREVRHIAPCHTACWQLITRKHIPKGQRPFYPFSFLHFPSLGTR